MHTEDGPSLRGRSDERFWHLKRYNTAATRIAAMHCAVSVQADRGSGQTGREGPREYSQDHGAGDRCGESVGILYSLSAENTGQDLSREIDPNVTLSEIKLKSIRMRLWSYFFSCTVLSTILKPKPIAVVEDSSRGSSSCTIAVTKVEVGEKTSRQPTQDKAV